MLVKDQSNFYEICSIATCINIEAFFRVNRTAEYSENIFETFGKLYGCLLKMIQPQMLFNKLPSKV